jgi:adenylate cyclase class IV
MKITSFNPLIVTKDAENVIKLFEDLGFEKRHSKISESNDMNVASVRMRDANGFHVDVSHVATLPQDMTVIRMNVDDLEEAENILIRHGFVNANPEKTVETPSHKSIFMVSPSGFAIDVIKHIKDHD